MPFLNECDWRVSCPDYGGHVDLISLRPNFYSYDSCISGGPIGILVRDCNPGYKFSPFVFMIDIAMFGLIFVVLKFLIHKTLKRK